MRHYNLENPFLQFQLDPEALIWSIYSRTHGISVQVARMRAITRIGRMLFDGLRGSPRMDVELSRDIPSCHGLLQQLQLVRATDDHGLRSRLTFACPQQYPFLFWQLSIENNSSHPVHVVQIEMLRAGKNVTGSTAMPGIRFQHNQDGKDETIQANAGSLAFFSNGWGSWNYSGAYACDSRFQRTRLGFLSSPLRVNQGTPQPTRRGHFSSDMFGVLGDRKLRTGILAGYLSQLEQFGSLEARLAAPAPMLRMWANGDEVLLPPGEQFCTDWACLSFLELDTPDPLGLYVEAVARQHGLAGGFEAKSPVQTGWTSWYHFLQNITPADILANLEAASALRPEISLGLIQIDDGFERQVGDWFSFTPGFQDGPAPLSEAIRQSGFVPGLWLAPFIVDPRSQLARDHPDWLLRGLLNRPVNAGYVLRDTFMTALDLTHPDALAYAADTVQTAAQAWGFPFLKLDFLYAGALPGRHRNPALTRAQILRLGLQRLREAAGPDVTLLGCGCPLGPAIGLVDQMRVGPDVSDRWNPAYLEREFFFRKEPDFPSTRNAIHNTLARTALHGRWWQNDPDCLLLRPTTRLSLAEVQTVATVILLSGGSLLVSDHLPSLPADRLRILQALLPPIGRRPRAIDWLDSPTPERLRLDLVGPTGAWHLLAYFNWEDKPRDLHLSPKDFGLDTGVEYLARDFWNETSYRLGALGKETNTARSSLTFPAVPAHGVIYLAVRQLQPALPGFAGSSLHASQGLEVTGWKTGPDFVELELIRPGHAQGVVDLYLPSPPQGALLNGQPVTGQRPARQTSSSGIYTFPVLFDQTAHLEIHFGPIHA